MRVYRSYLSFKNWYLLIDGTSKQEVTSSFDLWHQFRLLLLASPWKWYLKNRNGFLNVLKHIFWENKKEISWCNGVGGQREEKVVNLLCKRPSKLFSKIITKLQKSKYRRGQSTRKLSKKLKVKGENVSKSPVHINVRVTWFVSISIQKKEENSIKRIQ